PRSMDRRSGPAGAGEHQGRQLAEGLDEVLAEAAEIVEAAGEGDVGDAGVRIGTLQHPARMAEAHAAGELQRRVAATLLEGAEDAARAGAGDGGQLLDRDRAVPLRLD